MHRSIYTHIAVRGADACLRSRVAPGRLRRGLVDTGTWGDAQQLAQVRWHQHGWSCCPAGVVPILHMRSELAARVEGARLPTHDSVHPPKWQRAAVHESYFDMCARWSNVANLPRRKRDTDNVDVVTSLPFHLSLAMNLW